MQSLARVVFSVRISVSPFFSAQHKNMERDMMEHLKCKQCGAALIKVLNVDRKENGGGKFLYLCPNIACERVRDAFDYTHLEVYCVVKAQ